MIVFEWIRFLLGTALLLGGLAVFFVEVFGIFKFDYVLNRMHAAATGDTLGIALSLAGLMVMLGFSFTSFKLLLVIVFFWIAAPVSSHMLARFEVATNERLFEDCGLPEEEE